MTVWRAAFLLLCASASLTTPAGATAQTPITVTHTAPVPCVVACAYYDVPESAGFHACNDPFPPGSFDRSRFRFTGNGIIVIETRPVIDYDTFVCTVTEPSYGIGACGFPFKCTYGTDSCTQVAGRDEILIGCPEYIDLTLNLLHAVNGGANDEFFVVSYNWSDHAPLPVTVTGPAELLDDSYEAMPL